MLTKEEIIENIKDIGQSLIDNANKMVPDYKYFKDIIITCYANERDEAPYISIDTSFIPENFIERFK
jgi:hypothetical protein